jgi:hypothetical protein
MDRAGEHGLPLGGSAVSCPTKLFCAAIDTHDSVVTFNGTSWSAVSQIDTTAHDLEWISCSSSSFCAAVDGNGNVLTYTTGSWSGATSIDSGGDGLRSVSRSSASSTGASSGPAGRPRPTGT